MPETKNEEGAEVVHAPGEDLSLKSTETLLEEMASTMLGADITETVRLHYTEMSLNGAIDQSIVCNSLDTALKNAKTISASSTVWPKTVRITTQKVITTPEVEVPIPVEPQPAAVQGASWKAP